MSYDTKKLSSDDVKKHNLNVKLKQLKKLEDELGVKHDSGKPDMSLLPAPALTQIAEVLTFGANKYDKHNWRKGMEWSRISAAAMRHLVAWNEGEDLDPESRLNHLAHAACCLTFLLTYVHDKTGIDDRYKNEKN